MKRHIGLIAVMGLLLFACQQQGEEGEATQPEGQPPQEQQQQTPQQPEQQKQQQPAMEQAQPAEGQTSMAGEMPPPEGQAFLQYISKDQPYKQWELWPGKGEMYPGTEPHGSFLTTYVNEQALQAINRKPGQMPPGAIIVKENYTPAKELAAITAIYKVEGFNPEAGNWYWIKFSPEGEIAAEGKVDSCISCHQRAQGNDFLFTGPVTQSQESS